MNVYLLKQMENRKRTIDFLLNSQENKCFNCLKKLEEDSYDVDHKISLANAVMETSHSLS